MNLHLMAISQKIPQPSIIKISLNITLKFYLNLRGANGLSKVMPVNHKNMVALCLLMTYFTYTLNDYTFDSTTQEYGWIVESTRNW